MNFGDELKRHLSQKEVEITGKKYCTNCGQSRPPETGVLIKHRWLCGVCAERRARRAGPIPRG